MPFVVQQDVCKWSTYDGPTTSLRVLESSTTYSRQLPQSTCVCTAHAKKNRRHVEASSGSYLTRLTAGVSRMNDVAHTP